jgi:diaminopimelate epimerase
VYTPAHVRRCTPFRPALHEDAWAGQRFRRDRRAPHRARGHGRSRACAWRPASGRRFRPARGDRTRRQADLKLTFFNADGSPSAACGNATRCIARYEMEARDRADPDAPHRTRHPAGARRGHGLTSVNMGQPMTDWADIPLAEATDTLHLPMDGDPVATSMGNPHCTFFVDGCRGHRPRDARARDRAHPLFPERTNVQVASLIAPDHLRMRVWERGTGITLASGSSSCAVAVAAARRGLTGRTVRLDARWRGHHRRLARHRCLDDRAHGACLLRRSDRRLPRGAVAWTAAPPSSTRSAAASTPTRPRR